MTTVILKRKAIKTRNIIAHLNRREEREKRGYLANKKAGTVGHAAVVSGKTSVHVWHLQRPQGFSGCWDPRGLRLLLRNAREGGARMT